MASGTRKGRSPGQLVRSDGGTNAFIPNPLPPKLDWNNAVAYAVSKADLALGQLAGVGQRLPNPHRLVRMFLRREAELSSRIEQTQARVQTMLLFEHIPSVADEVPAVREVANNYRVLQFAFESARQNPISLTLLRRMHEILLDGVGGSHLTPGRFRQVQNWIGSSRNISDARYVPPPPHEVDACMRALVNYARSPDDLPTIVRCAIVHYQFEAIHPFVDGNGRVGRALMLLLLHAEKVLPVPLLNPSAQLEQNRREYYDLMLGVSRDGDWLSWITFFAQCVTREAEDACQRLKRLIELRERYAAQFSSARTTVLLVRLIDELMAEPALTAHHAADLLHVSMSNAQRLVGKLVAVGILREVTGKNRNRVYIAQEIVDLFSTDPKTDAST